MPKTIFDTNKIRYAAIAVCLFLSVLALGFALPHIAKNPSDTGITQNADVMLGSADMTDNKDIASEEPLTEEERIKQKYIAQWQHELDTNKVLQLQDVGLPTYDPRISLKKFCNEEALKIDAVTQKGLYTMSNAPYYQCKAIISFYCNRNKRKKSCVLRADGSTCSSSSELDEDCAPFKEYVEKAYAPAELREQHLILLGLVKDQPR